MNDPDRYYEKDGVVYDRGRDTQARWHPDGPGPPPSLYEIPADSSQAGPLEMEDSLRARLLRWLRR